MAGTRLGGMRAATTNKLRHGDDFYAVIGAKGGKKGNTGGFFSARCYGCEYSTMEHKVAECAGRKGGLKSRRNK